jgi:Tol biopolymer transport system component
MDSLGESSRAGKPGLPTSPEQIRRQLQAIVISKRFRHSRSLVKFLEYVVEETIAQREGAIKEYVIGEIVFGRGAGFDPKLDTIVRVQAGNLRSKLADYYAAEGCQDPLVIELPRGSYVPQFHVPVRPAARSPRWNSARIGAAVACAAFLLGAGVVWWGAARTLDFPAAPIERLTFDSGFTGHPAVSRDGKWLAYASDRAGDGATDIWVQATNGTVEPIRITNDPARDETPDFSPDGSRVVFRSWRDGGGIWISPANRSEPRLLAAGGYSPRFSPDGRWVAYFATGPGDTDDRIFVVPAEGGRPKALPSNADAVSPLWTPDGKHILYVDATARGSGQYDWFVAAVDGDEPVRRVGLSDWFARQHLGRFDKFTRALDWMADDLLFVTNELRAVPISHRTWTVSGPTRTVGSTGANSARAVPSLAGSFYVYYGLEEELVHLWTLPVSAETGEASGPPEQLVTNPVVRMEFKEPDLQTSGDSGDLFFVSSLYGNPRMWRVRSSDNRLIAVNATPAAERRPVPDRTGARVLYQAITNSGKTAIAVADEHGTRTICADCGEPLAWLPGERAFLANVDGSLAEVDAEKGARRELWRAGRMRLADVALSHDGAWAVLVVAGEGSSLFRAFISRYPDGLNDPSGWIPIASVPFWLFVAWSRDDRLVYFFDVDAGRGNRCLYAQRLGSLDKRRLGSPFAVQHFHRNIAGRSHIGLGPGRLIFSLVTRHSNIWRTRVGGSGKLFFQQRFPFLFHR